LEIRDMLEQWQAAGLDVDRLRIGGGAVRSPLWNQIQADVYGRPVETLRISESAALGAALMGGVGSGVFASVGQAVDAMVHVTDRIEPNPENHRRYEQLYQAYRQAYQGLDNSGAFATLAQIQAGEGRS
jgi:xylulokinase